MKLAALVVTVSALVASAAASPAQTTIHVTGVHDWTVNDPAPVSRGPKVFVIVATADGKRYTAEQLFTFGSQHFEVGADYTVVKADAKSLTVVMHDKKGHEVRSAWTL